jgi:RNA polymerase sigma factor (TIGR02999 family)
MDHDSVRTEVTALLSRIRGGDDGAARNLADMVYHELRGLAGAIMRSPGSASLNPTSLVHEAWLKMAGNLGGANDRAHFFAIAAQAMRQILADHARAAKRLKRGGGAARLTLDGERVEAAPETSVDLVAFHDSLERLASLNERHAKVVELRVLGALTIEETAEALGVSPGTVKSDWSMARAWLLRELTGH